MKLFQFLCLHLLIPLTFTEETTDDVTCYDCDDVYAYDDNTDWTITGPTVIPFTIGSNTYSTLKYVLQLDNADDDLPQQVLMMPPCICNSQHSSFYGLSASDFEDLLLTQTEYKKMRKSIPWSNAISGFYEDSETGDFGYRVNVRKTGGNRFVEYIIILEGDFSGVELLASQARIQYKGDYYYIRASFPNVCNANCDEMTDECLFTCFSSGSCTIDTYSNNVDSCTTASTRTLGTDCTISGTTSGGAYDATHALNCEYSVSGNGHWFRLCGTGNEVTVTAYGFNLFDTKLHVYTGCDDCDDMACVTSDDDSSGYDSSVTFETNSAQTYYVYISGWGGATGDYQLVITEATDD